MGVPYEYRGTLKWIDEIEFITHIILDDGVIKEVKAKENNLMIFKMQGRMGARFTHQPKVVIFSDYEKVMGIKNLCEEFGVNSCHLISAHSLKNITNPFSEVVHFQKEKDRIEFINTLENTLIMDDEVTITIAKPNNTTQCISLPLVTQGQIATHLPFMGIKGADYFCELFQRYFKSLV